MVPAPRFRQSSVVYKMLMKSGLFLLLVTVLEVSARHKNVKPDFIENVIKRESETLASSPSRIVSGWEAQPGQHPHHAALRIVDSNGGVSACGGSLVSKEWVITAAHCTAGRITAVVRAGVVSLTTPEYIFETTEWFNHPLYNELQPLVVQPHDISIVKLQRPVVYNDRLRAIRVQPSGDAYRNYENEQVYASGHGRTWSLGSVTEVLRWVYLTAVSNPSCAGTFGSALIIDTSICARFFNVTSQSTCQGDSGGPLVHVGSDGIPTLIGVASFVAGGDFGCHSGLPAGFIRPGPYLSWFKEKTGIDFENLKEDDDVSGEPSSEEQEPDDSSSSEEQEPDVSSSSEEQEPDVSSSSEEQEPDVSSSSEEQEPDVSSASEEREPDDSSASEEREPDDSSVSEEQEPEDSSSSEEEKPDPEESEEEEDSGSSDSNEDDDMAELLKRLEVKVKVNVRFNKYKLKKEVHKEKEIKKHH